MTVTEMIREADLRRRGSTLGEPRRPFRASRGRWWRLATNTHMRSGRRPAFRQELPERLVTLEPGEPRFSILQESN